MPSPRQTFRAARDRLRRAMRPLEGAIKRAGGRVLRPFVRMEIRRAAETGQLAPLVGGLWDTIANQQAQIHGLLHRIEFVRNETMFELRAKLAAPLPGAPAPTARRIGNAAKIAALRPLRLNIGCGHLPLDGYINVDARDLPGVDLVADAADLGLAPGSVAEIHSAHMLEHFPLEHLRRVILPHWRDVLAPGALMRAVVPDAEAMIKDYAQGAMSFDDLREVTFGLQDYDGDFHFVMFSRAMFESLLREAGFEAIEFEAVGRRNGKCREMSVRARKA